MPECKEHPEKYGQDIIREENSYKHTGNKKNKDGERDID